VTSGLETLFGIETPALVVNEAALRRNIAAMAHTAGRAGVSLRPHVKTHKSAEIGRLQVEEGAIGLSCATVAELHAFSHAGFDGLLLTSPVFDLPKLQRLAGIMKERKIGLVVDHADQVRAISALVSREMHKPRVLVDVDVGQKRSGVCNIRQLLEVVNAIAEARNLEFAGIQAFAGQIQHIRCAGERERAARDVSALVYSYISALSEAGHRADIVTGSGTGAAEFDCSGPYTELQVGSYVFMDADYGLVQKADGRSLSFEPSLFVLATVVCTNRQGDVTIDAGVKALAFNGPPPSRILGAPEGATFRFAGDEHGIVDIPSGSKMPPLGAKVLVLTTHCDPTVNLHGRYTVVRCNGQVDCWPIVGRYGF
jgi:D-serine deaminase-like pyridoxal phosphate-dependent protein